MPSGQNPWNQALKKRRRRNAGSLEALRRQLWDWLRIVDDGLQAAIESGEQEIAIRWIHAGNQTATSYIKATLDGDLEARLKALEAKLSEPIQ